MAAGHWQATDLNDNSQMGAHGLPACFTAAWKGTQPSSGSPQSPEQEVSSLCVKWNGCWERALGNLSHNKDPGLHHKCKDVQFPGSAVQLCGLLSIPGSSSGGIIQRVPWTQ